MVYEVKCDNCGDIIDFGGKDPEDQPIPQSKIPDNALKFNGNVYCRPCVKEFVEFGIGDVEERIEYLEGEIENLKSNLDMQKSLED